MINFNYGGKLGLSNLIKENASLNEIATWLNELTDAERLQETRSLSKQEQRDLFERAADNAPLTLDFFASTEVGQEVIHEGKNTLPAFTLFQKRFVRLESGQVVGYNHASTMGLIGPGYFVVRETTGQPDWEVHGSIVVDYYEVPESNSSIPEHWPKIKQNHRGLQVLVYNKMHDFMRRVSDHVSIGAAFKKGKSIDSYFLLCRQ